MSETGQTKFHMPLEIFFKLYHLERSGIWTPQKQHLNQDNNEAKFLNSEKNYSQ